MSEKPAPVPQTVQSLAVVGLVITALATVLGVVYSAVVKGSQTAQALLGTLATAALSALILLASGRHGKDD